MSIQAQTADGTTHEFPDGTPDSVIDNAMRSYTQQQALAGGGAKAAGPAAPAAPKPAKTSQALGFAKGIIDPIDRLAQRLDRGSQALGIPMDKINRGLGLPTADEAVASHAADFARREAQGVKPGGVGEFAGNTALTLAAAPAGLVSGGLVAGGLLSKSRPEDVSGFVKDIGLGGITSKIGGEVLNRGVKALGNAGARALTKAPSAAKMVDQLRTAKTAAYDRVKQLGIQYTPEAVDRLWGDIGRTIHEFRAHPDRHAQALQAIDTMADDVVPGQPASMDQLDNWRQIIFRDVVDSGDKATADLGKKLARAIDNFTDTAKGADMHLPGATAEASEAAAQQGKLALDAAREANKRYRNVELIDRKMRSGLSKAARTYGGHNIDNRIRQTLGPLVDPDSPQNVSRFLKPDEMSGLEDVVHGTPARNLLRDVGQFSPTDNPLKALVSMGAASTTGGLSLLASGAGFLAKLKANSETKKAVGNLVEMMANGGTRESMLAARQLRTMAAKNSEVGKWAKAIGLDLGEYGTAAATTGAVNKQRQTPLPGEAEPIEVNVNQSTNPEHLAWRRAQGLE